MDINFGPPIVSLPPPEVQVELLALIDENGVKEVLRQIEFVGDV